MPYDIRKEEKFDINKNTDVFSLRKKIRELCSDIGFSLVDVTKVVTISSELSRNVILYAKKGKVILRKISNGSKKGIMMVFEDNGPGIENIKLAMTNGYTTSKGLGLGLSGSKRLSDEFSIESKKGEGTKIVSIKWKR